MSISHIAVSGYGILFKLFVAGGFHIFSNKSPHHCKILLLPQS